MIVKKTRRSIQFLRTTAIGGLLFLLPLIVVAALVSQVAPILLEVSTFLHDYLPDTNSISISTIVSAVLALPCHPLLHRRNDCSLVDQSATYKVV